MTWGRAVALAFAAVFGLTACVFNLSGGDDEKPAKPARADQGPRDEVNWAKMQAFLEAFKRKEGVKVLDNGMAYRVITPGSGKGRRATWASTVIVRYKGMLVDGKVFDEVKPEQKPAELELNSVVKGWQEIVPLMRDGDKWEVAIPPELAYGREGRPPAIGPDQVLVFEIELVGIK
jgi:FKBP-type peptidyl-prolyl cis-trans isomerase FklB